MVTPISFEKLTSFIQHWNDKMAHQVGAAPTMQGFGVLAALAGA